MSSEPVTRDVHAIVTVHASTEGVARKQATEEVEAHLRAVANGGPLIGWNVTDSVVEEYPVAPFEPFQIAISLTFTVETAGTENDDIESTIRAVLDVVNPASWRFAN